MSLALAKSHGAFLFQIRADLFPEGYLTLKETLLWGKFYEDLKNKDT